MTATPEFVFAKGLAVRKRFWWIAGLAVLGVLIQLFASVFVGWVLVLIAVLLGVTRSVTNKPSSVRGGDWQNVTMAEVEEARELLAANDQARRAAGKWSCASAAGCFGAVVLLVCVGFVALVLLGVADQGVSERSAFLPVSQGGSVALLFVIDALTLFVPMWLFGGIKAWEPPHMRMRLEQLTHIQNALSSDARLEFQPSLQVAKTSGGSVPTDCKLMIKVKDAGPSFMGIQVQTSLNDVQGTKHPYTYCVLIARPEFGLTAKVKQAVEAPPRGGFMTGLFSDSNAKKEAKFARYADALVETKTQDDVDIAVVRQNTSGTGYKTSPDQALRVVNAALKLAFEVLGQ